jgi:hypothetical protein
MKEIHYIGRTGGNQMDIELLNVPKERPTPLKKTASLALEC